MSQIAKERSDFMPELSTLKLYMPLTADRTRRGRDDPTELSGRDLLRYEDVIRQALHDNQHPDEAERGIMHWYGKEDTVNQKVKSVVFTVETRDDELWGVAECRLSSALTPEEMVTLTDYISGQASDGWCEGFAQREIRVGKDDLNVHLWNSDDWSIMTEEERFDPEFAQRLPELCWSVSQVDGRLICIKKGEEGYYPSEWDTGDAEKNRKIADHNNEKRGITPAQEQAMVCGSMFGWSSPGTDPQRYEQWGPEIGGM